MRCDMNPDARGRAVLGSAIFLGAFLLFQVQPVIAKAILPWFGGAPAVWTTCMLFFQCLLLAGYAYAHASTLVLKPKAQGALHLVLLLAAACTLPLAPLLRVEPAGSDAPLLSILSVLV